MLSTAGRRCVRTQTGRALFWRSSARRTSATSQRAQHYSSNGGDETEKKRGGSYTRILAVFALAIPIGWAIKSLNDSSDRSNTTRPTDFIQYTLTKREPISSTCSIFTLKPAHSSAIDTMQLYDPRAITSVQFKQPQLQIARSYTVLPPLPGQSPDELRFLIRKEQRGEVSGYLHRLDMGAVIEMRGLSVEYVLPENVTDVVYLAGGTGIAPALQVASGVTEHGRMHILWANRRREDCVGGVSDAPAQIASGWSISGWWSGASSKAVPSTGVPATGSSNAPHPIVQQIDGMKRSAAKDGLLVDYYVDEEGTFLRPADVAKVLPSTTTEQHGHRLLLVSGPEGFVNYWAGPKQWVGGREVQGPLGGALATLDLRGWQVIKL